jgi:UDP-N-acetylmuramoyl-tripeptide--D-alanyl-D-alanine ligase
MGFAELARSIGARYFPFTEGTGFNSVSVDSRDVREGALFVALNGASCDGHSFVHAAFAQGARGAMVESSKLSNFDLVNLAKKSGKELIAVDNSLKGLQDSARSYLKKFPKLRKIGITGSSGKTTTKEIAAAIISSEKNTVMNKGNLNSETGLPLSAFEVRSSHEAGVFELGMNRKGEMAELASVLEPNIALITNIGRAHIGIIGSIQAIAEEKKNIFSLLTDNDAALIPIDDEYRDFLSDGVKGKVKFYGEGCFNELEDVRYLGLDGTEILWAGEKIRFALPGKHSLKDAIAAIAIAREIPVSDEAIKRGLETVKPLFGRLEILKGRTTVIRDCYNANPESTAKSVEFCDSLDWQGRRLYVIADMLELGRDSFSAHEQIGSSLAESKADMIFLFGREIEAAAGYMAGKGRTFYHTENMDELSAAIDSYARTGDLVLLKGSRGCALERLSGMLTEAENVS